MGTEQDLFEIHSGRPVTDKKVFSPYLYFILIIKASKLTFNAPSNLKEAVIDDIICAMSLLRLEIKHLKFTKYILIFS